MDVSVRYEVDGRQVSQEYFFKGLEGQIKKVAVDELIERAQAVTCPEHGQRAEVSEVIATSEGFTLQLSGCCDDLVERAQANMA